MLLLLEQEVEQLVLLQRSTAGLWQYLQPFPGRYHTPRSGLGEGSCWHPQSAATCRPSFFLSSQPADSLGAAIEDPMSSSRQPAGAESTYPEGAFAWLD